MYLSSSIGAGQMTSFNVTVVNGDEDRFGADANEFKVERWLSDEAEKLRAYKGLGRGAWDGLFNFGSGTRACPGYISHQGCV